MKNLTDWMSPIFMLLVGSFLLVKTHLDNSKYNQLRNEGVEVISQPLNEYTEYTHSGQTNTKLYTVAVTYTTKNGKTITKDDIRISQHMIDMINQRDIPALKVKYLPNDPEFISVEGSQTESDNEIWKMGGFLLILGGLVYGVMTAFSLWRRKKKAKA